MTKLYGLIVNHGDGSGSVQWFSKEEADMCLAGHDFETYYMNEGEYAAVITIPEGMTKEDIIG